MIYRIAALVIVVSIILVPLVVIAWAGINLSWIAWGFIPVHIWSLRALFNWIKDIDQSFQSQSTSGSSDKVGADEDVIAVIRRKKTKKI